MRVGKYSLLTAAVFLLVVGTANAGPSTAVGGTPTAPERTGTLTPLNGVGALGVYNGTVQFTCTTFTAAGTGSHVLDRDNTGVGQEANRIDVTDGAGTLIYTLTFQNNLGTYAGGLINTTLYATAPAFNPLTFTVTSLAGNGLPAQVDFVQQGFCAQLPQFNSPVPTVSGVGLVALTGLLAAAAVLVLRRVHPL